MAFTFVMHNKSKQKYASSHQSEAIKLSGKEKQNDFLHAPFLLTFAEIGKIVPIDNFKVLLLKIKAAECFILPLL